MEFPSLARWRVLLVDDDEEDYLLTRSMLRDAQGVKIDLDWASTYEKGDELIRSQPYDAVLIDYDLGPRNGIELIRAITALNLPCAAILYSGRSTYEVDVQAMEAGASLYLTKGEANPLLLQRALRYAIERKRFRDELDRSLKERSDILESIRDGFMSFDASGRIIYLNRHGADFFHLNIPDVLGRTLHEVFPHLMSDQPDIAMARILRDQQPFQTEIQIQPTGRWINLYLTPSAEGVSAAWTDITERKQTEAAAELAADAARRSQEQWRLLAEAMPVLVWTCTPTGESDYLSAQWVSYTGIPAEDQLGDRWLEQVHPDDRPPLFDAWKRTVASQQIFDGELRIRRHDGQYRWFKTRAVPIRDDNGQIIKWYGSNTDIHDLKQAQQNLQDQATMLEDQAVNLEEQAVTLEAQTEELDAARAQTELEKNRLEAVFQALPVGIAITGLAGETLQTNQAYTQVWGEAHPSPHSVDEYVAFQAWWADTGQAVSPEEWASAQVVSTGEPVLGQLLRIRRFDGCPAFVINSAAPIRNPQGEIIGAAVAIQDITDLRRTEQALQSAESQYSLLFQAMDQGMVILQIEYDDDGLPTNLVYQDVNPAYEQITGVKKEERLGKRLSQIPQVQPSLATLLSVARTGIPARYERFFQPNQKTLLVSSFRVDPGRLAILFSDITQRKAAEAALQQRENELHLILDSEPALISYIDRDFNYRWANRSYNTWFHLPPERLLGQNVRDILGDAAWEAVQPYMRAALAGNFVTYEAELPYKSGARWVRVTYTPDIDANGVARGFVVHVVDIEEQKEADQALKHYAARLASSNQALEDFVFIASHDLREPMRKVLSFGRLLDKRDGASLSDQGRDYLQRMQLAAARMEKMLDGLLAYSRVTIAGEHFTHVDLNQVLKDVLNDLEMRIEQAGAQVECAPLPSIFADPSQIRQLFVNLLSNAVKFSRPGTPPRVKVFSRSADPQWAEIRVQDNGVGLSPGDVEALFQPFRRLNTQYEGSGMGLAICHKIVERHRGTITVESEPGRGATFIVKLPL